jgi:hypothetical protein
MLSYTGEARDAIAASKAPYLAGVRPAWLRLFFIVRHPTTNIVHPVRQTDAIDSLKYAPLSSKILKNQKSHREEGDRG